MVKTPMIFWLLLNIINMLLVNYTKYKLVLGEYLKVHPGINWVLPRVYIYMCVYIYIYSPGVEFLELGSPCT